MRYLLMINDLKFAIQATMGFGNYSIVVKMARNIFKMINRKKITYE